MILNPVISGGAEEKKYRVTDETGSGLDGKTYLAGEIVKTEMFGVIGTIVVATKEGSRIPFSNGDIMRATFFFVMPAQDVRIYAEF